MYDSTLTLSRIGVILTIDADYHDTLFKAGVDYTYKNFATLFQPTQKELLRKFLDKVFNTGKLQCIEFYNENSLYQLKCVVSHAAQAICIITNTTGQRKMLSELEGNNLKTLVDTYADWVWSFDTNFTLVTANKAFLEARQKLDKERLHTGDNIFKYVQEENYKKWMPIYERTLKGEVICFEEKRNFQEHVYYVEIYLTPVYSNQNEIIGCLGVTRDITERKKAQLAIEGYTAKLEEFAFRTSHELRKPIANIIGMTGLLSSDGLNEDDRSRAINFIGISVAELDAIVISMIEMIDQYQNNSVK